MTEALPLYLFIVTFRGRALATISAASLHIALDMRDRLFPLAAKVEAL